MYQPIWQKYNQRISIGCYLPSFYFLFSKLLTFLKGKDKYVYTNKRIIKTKVNPVYFCYFHPGKEGIVLADNTHKYKPFT